MWSGTATVAILCQCSSRQIAGAGGCEDSRRPILDAELAKDPADVELDSTFKQLELARNFLVGFPLRKHDGNFALARRKIVARRQHHFWRRLFGRQLCVAILSAKGAGGNIEFARHYQRQSM